MAAAITETTYAGYDCLLLSNQRLKLWTTVSCGPRIIGLSLDGSENIFAVLPESAYITPAGLEYRFRGGHRLWHAPEDPERTYVPDDKPIKYKTNEVGIRLIQKTEFLTGIQKIMEISVAEHEPWVAIDHQLRNRGSSPVELAPWAITQLRPGGFAILPHPDVETGLLPNRRFALWPYTEINSPHIHWGDRYTQIRANVQSGKLKIGWANPDGWTAYWNDGVVFAKYAEYEHQGEYHDYGSSSECFCDPSCLELETLGPKTLLESGQSVSHREYWLLDHDGDSERRGSEISASAEKVARTLAEAKSFWSTSG